MDPFTVTVLGSRYPISVPVVINPPQPLAPSLSAQSDSSSLSTSPTSLALGGRRKPAQTYKSPTLHDGRRIPNENITQRVAPSLSTSSRTSASSSASEHQGRHPAPNSRQLQPTLPLYHPLGKLALSLPELDPRIFGLKNTVSIDDNDMQVDDADVRHGPSRTRKPTAKARDRDRGDEGDDQVSVNGAPAVDGVNPTSTTSPRKRRVAGAGGASGPKRRRRDTDDPSGTFPAPARRTRNPRGGGGVAVASPLAGVAAVAADAGKDGDSPASIDAPDLQTAVLTAQDARPMRSTRSRANLQRRDSTSSTGTSASVSIAVRTQQVRVTVVAPSSADGTSADVEMEDATPKGKNCEEGEGVAAEKKREVQATQENGSADSVADPETKKTQAAAIPPADEPEKHASSVRETLVDAESVAQPAPEVALGIAEEKSSEPKEQQKTTEDEKEEGELSDGPGS